MMICTLLSKRSERAVASKASLGTCYDFTDDEVCFSSGMF
jgi:hypothetical protein